MKNADMYRQYILEHYKDPKNWGELDDATFEHDDDNPLCGDELEMDVRLSDDGKRIVDIRFQGHGCAISIAATSILTQWVKGQMTTDQVLELDRDDMVEALGISVNPMRIKCAVLGLKVLQAGIHLHDQGRIADDQLVDDGPELSAEDVAEAKARGPF